MARLRVFHGHRLLDEFDSETHVMSAQPNGELVVFQLDPDGRPPREVRRYRVGDWHAGGHEIQCGYGAGQHRDPCDRCERWREPG